MTTKSLSKKLESELGHMTFGMFIRSSRTLMDMTQQEMADRLGMARGTLCDIEKGRQFVSVELAHRIAKAAGLSPIVAVEVCLNDYLRKAKLKYKATLKAS